MEEICNSCNILADLEFPELQLPLTASVVKWSEFLAT
jgi:hypothetical protein